METGKLSTRHRSPKPISAIAAAGCCALIARCTTATPYAHPVHSESVAVRVVCRLRCAVWQGDDHVVMTHNRMQTSFAASEASSCIGLVSAAPHAPHTADLQQRRGGDQAAKGALAGAGHALPEGVRMRGRVKRSDLH